MRVLAGLARKVERREVVGVCLVRVSAGANQRVRNVRVAFLACEKEEAGRQRRADAREVRQENLHRSEVV